MRKIRDIIWSVERSNNKSRREWKTFSPVILFGWNDTQNFSYGRAYSCALRCTGANAISLSLNKEMAKESQLKGLMPLRNPQDFLLSATIFFGYMPPESNIVEKKGEGDGVNLQSKLMPSGARRGPHFSR
jgi:hypothetical protein